MNLLKNRWNQKTASRSSVSPTSLPGPHLKCGNEWLGVNHEIPGMLTPVTATTEAFNSRWGPGNGWAVKETPLMQRRQSRSIGQICYGKHKDGMDGRGAKRISVGLDGRYRNDPLN